MGNFADLKQHATKVLKFTQGKTLPHLPRKTAEGGDMINAVQFSDDEFNSVQGGVCASLSCAWLKEKLTSADDPAFSGRSSGPAVHTGRNLTIAVGATPHQLAYAKTGKHETLFTAYGLTTGTQPHSSDVLKRDGKQIDIRERVNFEWRTRKGWTTEINVADSLVKACGSEVLKKGKGIYIAVSVVSRIEGKDGGGHGVAVYRSRGNTLYFFDPNCGVYQITKPATFFHTWVACYGKIGYGIEMNENRNDGFTYLDR
jgi:hypothetical protein